MPAPPKILTQSVTVTNEKGLHARTAAQIVAEVQRFPEAVLYVERDGYKVDGRSVLGLLTLSATQGTKLTLHISGKEAPALLAALTALFASGFLSAAPE
ncbi:MAG: HPr family phosphocarrier protein [Pseudomonadota bacterium]|nr:HPr family phosphocarrier protein [Pseudomonadota bacterium]QKK04230.1 MAG: HPr family phosphocarrier protein [Pseudomonadota bacterium]|tara:strand:- start:1872 stop:2168 length:297 start_codon:yes stop_codon:yes gene_type:complete